MVAIIFCNRLFEILAICTCLLFYFCINQSGLDKKIRNHSYHENHLKLSIGWETCYRKSSKTPLTFSSVLHSYQGKAWRFNLRYILFMYHINVWHTVILTGILTFPLQNDINRDDFVIMIFIIKRKYNRKIIDYVVPEKFVNLRFSLNKPIVND